MCFSVVFGFDLVCFLGNVKCISLSFYQHSSGTLPQVVRTPVNAVTSALAQVFSTRVIHGIESQHSFNLVAERGDRCQATRA